MNEKIPIYQKYEIRVHIYILILLYQENVILSFLLS